MKNQPFFKRFHFALQGIVSTWKTEKSFRTQSIFAGIVIAFLVVYNPKPIWWAVFLITLGMVLGAELFNTAIEYLSDEYKKEEDPAIKRIKDTAAAAVLMSAIVAIGVAAAFLVHILK
ncbi:MAG: diacylglycerol kinase [Bdellovibrionota bacterium]